MFSWSNKWLLEWPLKISLLCPAAESDGRVMNTPFCSKKSAFSRPVVSRKLPSSGPTVYRYALERAPDSKPPKIRTSLVEI